MKFIHNIKIAAAAAAIALLQSFTLAAAEPDNKADNTSADTNPAGNLHSELLAAQRPIAADIQLANPTQFIPKLDADFADSEIYNEYWESQLVNPYAGATIPDIKDIDVSSYVSPIDDIRVTSNFGYRARFRRQHKGIDLGLHVGDTVRAAFDGKVRICRYERKGYGYYVVIRHDNGMETVYGHLSKFICKPDDRVKAGDPIALGGNTGRSTGPHLHFETRFMGIAINPVDILDIVNKTPHNGIYTFDRAAIEKTQKATPARKKRTTARRRTRSK